MTVGRISTQCAQRRWEINHRSPTQNVGCLECSTSRDAQRCTDDRLMPKIVGTAGRTDRGSAGDAGTGAFRER